ncbi:MAG: D-alanyl-D-alanine carboxypeptidase/D-alanyl-D-alanine-endopeptidase [Candidatus Eisenbacteria bacterium]|nr:D-alanyl-D-alanine carboxypeptidase/D-alanyl-D-alanine-endopeptidase [Candidatus Eisenbacteria bacterium]
MRPRRRQEPVRRGRALAALALVAALVSAALAQPATAAEPAPADSSSAAGPGRRALERIDWVIESLLSRPELSGARVGVLVEGLHSGEVLYERNADELFIPASNMKIVTAAAALDILGPQYVYETVLSAGTPVMDGVLGDLYVTGHGDPSLVFEEMVRLAESLRLRGLERIAGDIVLDDTLFAVAGPVDPDAVDGDRAYHARVGALSFNFNAVAVRVSPGASSGDTAVVRLSPRTGFVEVRNRATTISSRSRSTVTVRRRSGDGGNVIVVEGRVPLGTGGRTYYRSLDDPTGWFGSALVAELDRAGVAFEGTIRRGATPDEAVGIAVHESKPVSLLVRDLGKYSNNFIAEQLVLAIAAERGHVPATTEAGAMEISEYLSEVAGHGDENGGTAFRVLDGSGFSRGNRLSPRVLVAVMRRALSTFETSYEFGGSLSVSGTDGTLSDRMGYPHLKRAVRAKTGLLDGVTGISGLMETLGGEEVLFSVLVNGFGCEAWRSHDMEHAILGSIREGR